MGGGRVGGGRVTTAPGAAVLGARIYVLGVAGDGCFQVTLLIQYLTLLIQRLHEALRAWLFPGHSHELLNSTHTRVLYVSEQRSSVVYGSSVAYGDGCLEMTKLGQVSRRLQEMPLFTASLPLSSQPSCPHFLSLLGRV